MPTGYPRERYMDSPLAIMTPLRRPRYVDENGGGRPVTSAFLGACEPVL